MKDYIKEYIKIRDYLNGRMQEMVEVYLCGIWDPLCKYVLIKETNKLIQYELKNMFPHFPEEYFPKTKFRVYEDDMEIEAGLQEYFNSEKNLDFLGNVEINSSSFDMYVKRSYDPNFDFTFVAKYGHDIDSKYEGSKTAAADYFIGKTTPLSVAYQMAVDEGFIS
jgi:hypothetical protein